MTTFAQSASGLLFPDHERPFVDVTNEEIAAIGRGARMGPDFPYPSRFHLPVIYTLSQETALGWFNQRPVTTPGSAASGTWPTANLAFIIPFRIWAPYAVQTLFWTNGATASGNLDVGIFSSDGTLLFNSGSKAQSGTGVTQTTAVSPAQMLNPGNYFMSLVASATTTTVELVAALVTQSLEMAGCAQMATAVPLPATLTFASPSGFSAKVPMFGFSCRASTLV